MNNERRSKINLLDSISFFELLRSEQMYNSSAKLAFLTLKITVDETSIHESLFYQNNKDLAVLKEEFGTIPMIFSVHSNDFFLNHIDSMMKKLLPSGIPQHSYAFKQFMLTDRKKLKFKKVPQVLTVNSLSFGFVIWLIAIGCAVIVFFCEKILHKFTKKKMKLVKIKFAKIHPINEQKIKPKRKNKKIKNDQTKSIERKGKFDIEVISLAKENLLQKQN
ncbi:hypothetical protein PVAND_002086 [Polypedilum vanderplanki]|nr:hypothetical protein PVAND_002086 [Polypedilum vanderplanki]